MQMNEKVFEVDQIVCRRESRGKEEFLVYWKGFDISSATWEPTENLLSCADLIEQFHRQASPIPGADPYSLSHIEKFKTVHIKMLMNRNGKRTHSKRSKSFSSEQDLKINNENDVILEESLLSSPSYKQKKLTESEKLIRDTLVHESKTMAAHKTSLSKINGILNCYDNPPIKLNGMTNGHSIKRSLNRCNRVRDTSKEEFVCYDVKKGYMQITLNNKERHNLLTTGMLYTLSQCLQKASANRDVKAVLLTNSGDYFCSGIDYSEFMKCSDDREYKNLIHELITGLRHFLNALLSFTKPLICAVNGPTMEFGMVLVIASDFAYASSKASFDLMYNKLGLTPIGCVTQLLPRVVGTTTANSMLYIGGRYSAVLASDRGLVLDMYGVNSFEEDMEKKMAQLTVHSDKVLESTKKLVKHFEYSRLEEICNEELNVYQQYLLCKEFRKKLKDDWTMLINLYGDF